MKIFKLNWGQSIVLVFILFAIFIGSMVYQMITANVEIEPSYKVYKSAKP